MGSQVAANSIDALKDLRVALAFYSEDTLSALGAVNAELRRTVHWIQQERPYYWQEQIKRRREDLAAAKAELFRKQLAKAPGSGMSTTEQMENVKLAEARLYDAEKRLAATRKWQRQLPQVVLEYQACVRRIKTLAAGEVPSAVNLLNRLIDALEAYIQVSPPSASSLVSESKAAPPELEQIATRMIDAEQPVVENQPTDEPDEIIEMLQAMPNQADSEE